MFHTKRPPLRFRFGNGDARRARADGRPYAHRGRRKPGGMEHLFACLSLAMQDMVFAMLSLGPELLAGLRPTPLSSRWHRLANLIWKHGERLYNFQGLHTLKSEFNPRREPRHFAASGAVGPFVALAELTALIGAGLPPFPRRRP